MPSGQCPSRCKPWHIWNGTAILVHVEGLDRFLYSFAQDAKQDPRLSLLDVKSAITKRLK